MMWDHVSHTCSSASHYSDDKNAHCFWHEQDFPRELGDPSCSWGVFSLSCLLHGTDLPERRVSAGGGAHFWGFNLFSLCCLGCCLPSKLYICQVAGAAEARTARGLSELLQSPVGLCLESLRCCCLDRD